MMYITIMPKISFSFSGTVSGANVTNTLKVSTMEQVDVSNLTSEELVDKIESGELVISLSDAMSDCDQSDAELSDYEVSE